MSITVLRYYAACKAQGLDRKSLPYYGYLQPFCAWYGLFWFSMVTLFYGYFVFRAHEWSTKNFFGSYTILGVDVLLYLFWKFFKKTKIINKHDIDLGWERPTIDAYEATFIDAPVGFWRLVFDICSLPENETLSCVLKTYMDCMLMISSGKCCSSLACGSNAYRITPPSHPQVRDMP